MTLGSLQSLGTLISLIALVITIAGLAVRTRQNTLSLRSLTYSRALDRLAAIQARLGADADLARVFAAGLRAPDKLTIGDRVRMTWIFYEMFGAFEFIHDQAHAKALPSDVWKRWAATVSWWISLPAVQAWWHAKPTPFNPRFSEFVDDRIAHPSQDEAADRRWLEFLRPAEAAPRESG